MGKRQLFPPNKGPDRQDSEPRPAKGQVTLKAVAEAAGVSPMTVSNFVNGKFQYMGQETRDKVSRAVGELGYRPDSAARGLRTARHRSVGMIVLDHSPHYLSDGFTTQVISGLSNSLNDQGYTLQLEGMAPERFAASSLIKHVRTDALCLMLSGDAARRQDILRQARAVGQPLVVFLEQPAGLAQSDCAVLQDEKKGGYLLARHLLERGARKLWVVKQTHNLWPAIEEREKGIRQALDETGDGAPLLSLGCGDGAFTQTQTALEAALARHGQPDGIMALNDQVGIAALQLCRTKGLRVPGDIKITGYNAFDFWHFSQPRLTTIRSSGYQIGQRGGAEVIRHLEQGAFSAPSVMLDVELVLGGTT